MLFATRSRSGEAFVHLARLHLPSHDAMRDSISKGNIVCTFAVVLLTVAEAADFAERI